MAAVDDYFSSLDAPARAAFEHIRDLATELVPGAGQGISYGMAALSYDHKPLLAFRAARHHLSIFPFSSRVVDAARPADGLRAVQGDDPVHCRVAAAG